MLSKSKSNTPNCPLDVKDLYNHFSKLSDPKDDFLYADVDVCNELERRIADDIVLTFDELNVPIELTEINHAIKQLKCGKSGGEDQLLNEFFVSGRDILSPYLVSLVNFIFDTGIFPDGRCEVLIVPLHKKGSMLNPTNYRGITLLSVLGRLFTRILNNRLDGWAQKYQICIEAQNGFRRGRGTADSAFILSNIIDDFLAQNVVCIFCRLQQSFDYVVHENLWYKLFKLG